MSLNRRELCEFLQDRIGLQWSEPWQRSKLLLADRLIPAGGRGPARGTDMEPKHAAYLLTGILSMTPVIEARRIAQHFTDEVRCDAPVEIDLDGDTIRRCMEQSGAEFGRRLIGNRPRDTGFFESITQHIEGLGEPSPGKYKIAPAGGFVDALAHLISMGAAEPGAFPWVAIRSVGITSFIEGGWLGWIQFRAAVPAKAVVADPSGQGDLFGAVADTGADLVAVLDGRRVIFADSAVARGFIFGSMMSSSREMPVSVLRDIGAALAGELSAKANGSPEKTDEPLEAHRTAAPTADTSMIVRAENTREGVEDARLTLRGASSSTGQPARETRSNGQPRGGGAERRRNAAQTQ